MSARETIDGDDEPTRQRIRMFRAQLAANRAQREALEQPQPADPKTMHYLSKQTSDMAKNLARLRGTGSVEVIEDLIRKEFTSVVGIEANEPQTRLFNVSATTSNPNDQKILDELQKKPIDKLTLAELEWCLEAYVKNTDIKFDSPRAMAWLILRLTTELRKISDTLPKPDPKIDSFIETLEEEKHE